MSDSMRVRPTPLSSGGCGAGVLFINICHGRSAPVLEDSVRAHRDAYHAVVNGVKGATGPRFLDPLALLRMPCHTALCHESYYLQDSLARAILHRTRRRRMVDSDAPQMNAGSSGRLWSPGSRLNIRPDNRLSFSSSISGGRPPGFMIQTVQSTVHLSPLRLDLEMHMRRGNLAAHQAHQRDSTPRWAGVTIMVQDFLVAFS